MDVRYTDKFASSIDYETGKSVLAMELRHPQEEQIINYQIEMIANNPTSFIIPFDMRRRDERVGFYYDITGLITLKDFLRHRRLSKNDFIDILFSITGNMIRSKSLLLHEKNFIISDEHIYVDTSDGRICMLYVPVRIDLEYMSQIKDFIINIITETVFLEIQEGDNYLQRIIEFLKAPDFSVLSLNKLLGEMKNEGFCNAALCELERIDTSDRLEAPKKKNNSDAITSPSKTIGGYEMSTILIAILSQVAVILMAIAMDKFLNLNKVGSDTRYIAIGLFVLVFDLLVYKYLFSKSKTQTKESNVKAKGKDIEQVDVEQIGIEKINVQQSDIERTGYDDYQKEGVNKVMNEELSAICHNSRVQFFEALDKDDNIMDSSQSDVGETGQHAHLIDSSANHNSINDETALLVHSDAGNAYLICEVNGKAEYHEINKDKVVIGRNAEVCDIIIHDKAVGRVHAEIVSKDQQYFVVDNDSRNGTYINDEKIIDGCKQQLNSGDIIVFAKVAFKFIRS